MPVPVSIDSVVVTDGCFNLVSSVPLSSKDIRSTLAEELDFEHEGCNLERCRRDLSNLPYVYLPQVEWGLTSKRVLTAEWIDGCRVTDKTAIAAMGLDVTDVRAGQHSLTRCIMCVCVCVWSL